MQWQMAQVEKFCKKYNLQSVQYTLPRPTSVARFVLYKHVLFDDRRKVLFTFIPKVIASLVITV